MTFEKWSEQNEQLIADGTYDLKDIWNKAQQNYPYIICDERMKDRLLYDIKKDKELSDKEAKQIIDEYVLYIIDSMWEKYNNALNCSINNFKKGN